MASERAKLVPLGRLWLTRSENPDHRPENNTFPPWDAFDDDAFKPVFGTAKSRSFSLLFEINVMNGFLTLKLIRISDFFSVLLKDKSHKTLFYCWKVIRDSRLSRNTRKTKNYDLHIYRLWSAKTILYWLTALTTLGPLLSLARRLDEPRVEHSVRETTCSEAADRRDARHARVHRQLLGLGRRGKRRVRARHSEQGGAAGGWANVGQGRLGEPRPGPGGGEGRQAGLDLEHEWQQRPEELVAEEQRYVMWS